MAAQSDYDKAEHVVKVKISFFIHLAVYVCVNALLVFINLSTAPQTLWFMWPMIGWGIGLVMHGIGAFISPALIGLKDKMIEKEMEKHKGKKKTR